MKLFNKIFKWLINVFFFQLFFRYRLDDNNDLYSDSDSISFNSLSRSSSLVQFETLERQLQAGSGDGHSFGGSTPSLNSAHAYDDTHKSDSLKRFSDTSDTTKGARNYFNVNKIDFTTTPYLNVQHHQQRINSSNIGGGCVDDIDGVSEESSSSENSFYSGSHGSDTDETILKIQRQPISDKSTSCVSYRCKNSVENLSEDSGYCEYSTLKVRSKSIPNFVGQPEHFIEEEEFENHKSLENIIITSHSSSLLSSSLSSSEKQQQSHIYKKHSGNNYMDIDEPTTTINTTTTARIYNNNCTTKIESTNIVANNIINQRYSAPQTYTIDADAKNIMRTTVQFPSTYNSKLLRHATQNISASLPNLSEHIDSSSSSSSSSQSSSSSTSAASSDDEANTFSTNLQIEKRRGANTNNSVRKTKSSRKHSKQQQHSIKKSYSTGTSRRIEKDFSIVSSVPNNLNICCTIDDDSNYYTGNSSRDAFGWNLTSFPDSYCSGNSGSSSKNNQTHLSVASKNLDLCDFGSGGGLSNSSNNSFIQSIDVIRQQKVINASYNNLTALDYSGTRQQLTTTFRKMAADNRKRNSGEFSRCNFLLDEISTHFDRELSILNDQRENYDPVAKFIHEEKMEDIGSVSSSSTRSTPPKPPPRKMYLQQKVYSEVNAPVSVPIIPDPQTMPTEYISSIASDTKSPPPLPPKYTFDRDPTNLVTCYAESLERCNFDIHGSTNSINSNKQLDNTLIPSTSRHAMPVHRQMVQSTPNLNIFKTDEQNVFMQLPSTHTSLNPLPQICGDAINSVGANVETKRQGILSLGSRTSLGKGVSFCPIVSEISWKEQSSEEIVDDDDADTDYADDSLDNCSSAENIIRYVTFSHREHTPYKAINIF